MFSYVGSSIFYISHTLTPTGAMQYNLGNNYLELAKDGQVKEYSVLTALTLDIIQQVLFKFLLHFCPNSLDVHL